MARKSKKTNTAGEKVSLRERMVKRLDIPPDLFPRTGLVELRGQNAVTVKGGGKILLYTPEEIRMGYGKGCLSVRGRRLVCTSYYVGAVGIEGYISEISFEDA